MAVGAEGKQVPGLIGFIPQWVPGFIPEKAEGDLVVNFMLTGGLGLPADLAAVIIPLTYGVAKLVPAGTILIGKIGP